jgi:hypothetical protein
VRSRRALLILKGSRSPLSANLAPRRSGLTIQRATAAQRVGLVSDSDDDDPVRILAHERAHCDPTLTVHADRE